MASRGLIAATVIAAVACPAPAGEFVPFVIPTTWSPKAEINFSSPAIGPTSPRLVATGGHFFAGAKRVRIWGVNLCFGACFPTHKDAERIAARMAAFGINSVRFHHMDSTAFPRGIWDRKDPFKLSSQALDRLDYLIDQLARKGIRSNINLHVSRTHSRVLKLPNPGSGLNYDKMVGIFTPALIEAQKKYARDLLTHVNPYRKRRYADDPAVAFVEITNENSLFLWGAEQKLRALPEFYATILRRRYAAWLKGRYGTTAKLRAAWNEGSQPLGKDMLGALGAASGGNETGAWRLEQHAGCRATAASVAKTKGVRIEIGKADPTGWHIQFNVAGLKLAKRTYYTLTFRARADKPRSIGASVGQADRPWGGLGLSGSVKLTAEWRDFRLGFAATTGEANARVSFHLSGSDTAVELADVRLRPGGRMGLGASESIEQANVTLYAPSETPVRSVDRMRFLAETEKAYFDDMRKFIKKDLGCGALVTGTIVFGPLGLWAQSDMDFIDGHAYWQHPRFPGRPWDQGNWLIEQKAMVNSPEHSPLFRLAAERLKGKPFTVSEYNHPAPNDNQAECVPMIATFAAAQDWDGVWLFTYSHSADNWDRQVMSGFFDIDTNPAKWGFVPAGTAIFRQGGIVPVRGELTVALGGPRGDLAELAKLHLAHDRDMFGIVKELGKTKWPDLLTHRTAVSIGGKTVRVADTKGGNSRTKILWDISGAHMSTFDAQGAGAQIFIANVHQLADLPFNRMNVQTITSLDGRPLAQSYTILVTACSRCENTDMRFSLDRRTVGRNWGKAPVRIEVSDGLWPRQMAGAFTCYALRPDGSRGQKVSLTSGTGPGISYDPKHETMWYLLVRKDK